jgi:hypothetical protein
MNIYAVIAVGAVIGLGILAIAMIRRRPKVVITSTTPPEAPRINQKPVKLGKTPGWVSIPSTDLNVALRLCSRQAMSSILVIQNKDGTRLRLKITMSDGSIVYSPPGVSVDEMNKQLNMIMAA